MDKLLFQLAPEIVGPGGELKSPRVTPASRAFTNKDRRMPARQPGSGKATAAESFSFCCYANLEQSAHGVILGAPV